MIIYLERTGGFSGMTLRTALDTADLEAGLAEELGNLVEKAAFYELPETLLGRPPGADRFEYTLRISGERGSHTVYFSEGQGPPDLRILVRRLTELRRSAPGNQE